MALDPNTLVDGDYFYDQNDVVWRVREFINEPTVFFERVENTNITNISGVSDPKFNNYTKLVPETP